MLGPPPKMKILSTVGMDGDQFQTTFCFLKKLYISEKQVVCNLVSIYFDSRQISIQQKQPAEKFSLERYTQF